MAKAAYNAPGLTLFEIETAVANALGWSITDTSQDATMNKIDEAITRAGQAAVTWKGIPWWWAQACAEFYTSVRTIATAANSGVQRSSNVATVTTTAVHGMTPGQFIHITCTDDATFNGMFQIASAASTTTFTYKNKGDDVSSTTSGDGTVSVVSYPVGIIDIAGAVTTTAANHVAPDVGAIQRVILNDDGRLSPLSGRVALREYITLFDSTRSPMQYAVSLEQVATTYSDNTTLSNQLCLFILGPPDVATDKITIPYIRRHSKITNVTSLAAGLIVPAEYHYPVYVNGAEWLLRHEKVEIGALRDCAPFVAAMDTMAQADPSHDYDAAEGFAYPADARVTIFPTDGSDSDYNL